MGRIYILLVVILIGLVVWFWNVTVEIGRDNTAPDTTSGGEIFVPPRTDTTSETAPAPNSATRAGSPASVPQTTVTTPTAVSAGEVATPKDKKVEVPIATFVFPPSPLTIKKGTTVVWTNKDDATHTVSSDSGLFSSGSIIKGNSYSFTFEKAGTYPYICGFHPGMQGVVEVTE